MPGGDPLTFSGCVGSAFLHLLGQGLLTTSYLGHLESLYGRLHSFIFGANSPPHHKEAGFPLESSRKSFLLPLYPILSHLSYLTWTDRTSVFFLF